MKYIRDREGEKEYYVLTRKLERDSRGGSQVSRGASFLSKSVIHLKIVSRYRHLLLTRSPDVILNFFSTICLPIDR